MTACVRRAATTTYQPMSAAPPRAVSRYTATTPMVGIQFIWSMTAGSAVLMPYAISAGPSTRSAVETIRTTAASTSCHCSGETSDPSRRSERRRMLRLSSRV